jgi:hypothetical protein
MNIWGGMQLVDKVNVIVILIEIGKNWLLYMNRRKKWVPSYKVPGHYRSLPLKKKTAPAIPARVKKISGYYRGGKLVRGYKRKARK